MTDNLEPGVVGNLLRTIGSSLNFCVYFLLGMMYQIFFNVSSAQLFENETIKNFYGRIQLIIGVFMIFKLAVSILQGIMDPEKFTSGKEGGFGSIITRVVVALIMLAVIVPINIPDVQNANSYEKYINNNGLLFGTLYSLQDRILSGNTLGRLILGTTDEADDPSDSGSATQQEKLEQSANIFASTILKGFLRINMLPEDQRENDDETEETNWYCQGQDLTDNHRTAINAYSQLDISPAALLSDPIVKAKCNLNWQANVPIVNLIAGDSKYVFSFNFIVSLVVGAIFLVILVGFTIDIAIRSIKLAILRLLAPIPIISYIEPKSAKDGMFASWVKALTSTYLDLFLRLAVVYFVIFIIQDMMVNGIVIDQAGGMVGIISVIFIWIGLFFFARMAPKFIKDALGLKGSMTNIGLSGIMGGAATFVGGGGVTGAMAGALSSMNAGAMAAAQGKQAPPAWQTGADLAAQIKTGDPKAKGGLINSINDRLMREAGINRARKLYGVTANGVAMAKDNMFAANDEASRTQDLYNRFTQGNMDDYERAQYARDNRLILAGSREQQDEIIRNDMYQKMGAAQTRAAKAKSHYEEAKKFADSHRISPSFEEKYHRSLRERVGFGDNPRDRDDYHAGHYDSNTGAYVRTSNRRDEHQTVSDKIFGRPSDWRSNSGDNYQPHADNRWDPTKFSNGPTNAMHDNPDRDRDTPSAGGPPPR